jgi:hypothetical protein
MNASVFQYRMYHVRNVHCKKSFAIFQSPAELSLNKLPLDGRVWLVTSRLGEGKVVNLFLQCMLQYVCRMRHVMNIMYEYAAVCHL